MKLKLTLLFLFVALSIFSFAQELPSKVVFENGSLTYTLKQSKEGVKQLENNDIKIKFFIPRSRIEALGENPEIEVKWYYYMSTRKTLMTNKTIKLSSENLSGDFYVITSSNSSLTSGWWSVQAKIKNSSSDITFAGINEFSILIEE